jgi:hypothetical protein
VLGCVRSLETFPFVERHYAELANVPSLALVNCANMALPSHVHSSHFTRGHVSAYHPKVAQGGPHEAYVGFELVKVALRLYLIVFVWPGSDL